MGLSICLSGCFLHKHEDVNLDLQYLQERQAQRYAPATTSENAKAGENPHAHCLAKGRVMRALSSSVET